MEIGRQTRCNEVVPLTSFVRDKDGHMGRAFNSILEMLMTSICDAFSPANSAPMRAHHRGIEGIQELTLEEMEQVHGGVLPAVIVAAGAVAGAYAAWHSGGNAGQIAAGALLGGVAGMYGALGMVGSATAVTMIGSFAGGGGVWRPVYSQVQH